MVLRHRGFCILNILLGTGLQVEGEFRGGDLPGVEFGVRTSGCYYRALND